MNTTVLLRIASFMALLFAVGHTMGSPWTPTDEASGASVVEAMKSVHFDVMGANRSYWDFYYGFGISISVYLFAQAALLWLLASLARTQATAVRPLVVVLLASCALNGFVTWRYFFSFPLVLSIAIVVCLVLALTVAKPRAGT